MKNQIYLDNYSTTQVDKNVVKIISNSFLNDYGNPSSKHSLGRRAKNELNIARDKIARFIGADSSEIIFTSGGTESNNLALRGLALANPDKKHIITSAFEHSCIIETCESLKKEGYYIDYIGVSEDGFVDVNEIKRKIKNDTLVVSIMHVNNEIGTIQPIEEIGKICSEKKVYFHTDAVQSFTKLNINVSKMKISLMSVSGHKIHAPKGIGFLYVNRNVNISPIILGGGQERNIRSGTENIPGAVGLSAALDIKINKEKIKEIRDFFAEEFLKIPGTKINGSLKNRIFDNINISFVGVEGESLVDILDKEGILVSTGSACSSTKLSESHVLKAIGVDDLYLHGSLRLTFGEITKKEAEYVVEKIKENVMELSNKSPLKLIVNDSPRISILKLNSEVKHELPKKARM